VRLASHDPQPARAARAIAISVTEVTDEAGFVSLASTWSALFEAAPDATPFQSWEWISTWRRHHPGGQLLLLVARVEGQVVGILPLVLSRYRGSPLRQLRWMGAPLSDFQDLLASPPYERGCAAAFLRHLFEARDRWDLADLNDLREGGVLVRAERGGHAGGTSFHRHCPVIELPESWKIYAAGLGKSTRSQVGRRRRQLEKRFHAELVLADASTLHAAMERLFALHNGRWQRRGAAGAFADPAVQRFHHEVAGCFLQRGWLRLHLLRLDGVVRAAFYCFHRGASTYYYLSGFDGAIGKLSPGNVLMAHSIEQAIREGARHFELLRGDETYKYAWNAVDRDTVRLVLGHRSLRSRLALWGHSLERVVEHQGLLIQRRLWGGRRGAPQRSGDDG